MTANELLTKVKENLIITFNDDDSLILSFINAAISYAESYQHITEGTYNEIGRASVGKECVRRCRSRWSPYH